MKPIRKILFGALLLAGLQFGLSSCLTDGSRATGVYYGPQREPWFRDDSWMDGQRWHGGPRGGAQIGIEIHPPRQRR
jgi:hypothetical protein